MSNKKKLIIGGLVGILVGVVLGTTYAIFSYTRTGSNQELITGDIYMHYKESNSFTIDNTLPRDSYIENGYFEFTVEGKNTNTKYNIVYDINLNHGDTDNLKTRIQDRFLKFRLVEVVNNEEQEIFNNKSYLSIDNKRIYVATIPKNTNNHIVKRYRLYAWIDKSVVIGNVDYADYSQEEWNNLYASIKVSVTGDFSEKVIEQEPYLVMKNISTDTNWTNIRANVTSVEFSTNPEVPANAITSFDVTDASSAGDVTLYTLDDGLGTNTVKVVICGDDVIYAPVDATGMFRNCTGLEDASGINGWVINRNANFTNMFKNTTIRPTFTSVAGRWDSNGTFTPSN